MSATAASFRHARPRDARAYRRRSARGDADDPDLRVVRRRGGRRAGAEIAREFGVHTRWVGVFVGIVYAGAMFASLASGNFVERHGSIRVSQACRRAVRDRRMRDGGDTGERSRRARAGRRSSSASGYGPITPASSHLLQRTAPPSRLALTFSIKQTGVPAGVALTGAVLPAVTLSIGWRPAFAIVALAGAVVLGLAQPIRGRLDADRDPRRRFSLARHLRAARVCCASRPPLLELALVSLVYSATQVCLTSFLVAYLTETLHWSLVSAGFALAAATVGGVAGRIGWGYVADRLSRRVAS